MLRRDPFRKESFRGNKMFVIRDFSCLKLSVQLSPICCNNFADTKIDKSPVTLIICLINQDYLNRDIIDRSKNYTFV